MLFIVIGKTEATLIHQMNTSEMLQYLTFIIPIVSKLNVGAVLYV